MDGRIKPHLDAGQDKAREILVEATRRLKVELQPLQIFLFGSRARGDATVGSDFDLLAVVASSKLPRFRRAIAARRALMGLDASFDILVLTAQEWSRELASGVALANDVSMTGTLLHDHTRP